LCCRDKVITLSPYDVMRMADASGLGTADTIARYTLRRGSLLRSGAGGECIALHQGRCGIHSGRPLACRLYPLGLERSGDGERFIRLEPAPGSKGIYGENGIVGEFLEQQLVKPYIGAVQNYAALLPLMRVRICKLVDFDKTEPSGFRRIAVREALAESGYDYNALIEAMFDSDRWSGSAIGATRSPIRHALALRDLIHAQTDGLQLATAAVLLSVSLGYTPSIVFTNV
jgi:Fe-S-cluster containining protein